MLNARLPFFSTASPAPTAAAPPAALSILPVDLRWAIRRDLTDLASIDLAASPDPLSQPEILDRIGDPKCHGMVAESRGRVVGFMFYTLWEGGIELERIAVDPRFHRRRVGTQLVNRLKAKLTDRRRRIIAKVPDTLTGLHLFLREQGFVARPRIVRGVGAGRDAYRFDYGLSVAAARAEGGGR